MRTIVSWRLVHSARAQALAAAGLRRGVALSPIVFLLVGCGGAVVAPESDASTTGGTETTAGAGTSTGGGTVVTTSGTLGTGGSGRGGTGGSAECVDGTNVPAVDGCNTCRCINGKIGACTDEVCLPPTPCGPIGTICTIHEYCAYTDGQSCGAAGVKSTCQPRPQRCTTQYTPVCGCDGRTYDNGCEAARAGSGVDHNGGCTGDGRICSVDGAIYPSGTGGIYAPDGCNTCTCTDGVLTCSQRACPPPAACGGVSRSTCAAAEYCAYVEGSCGKDGASALCQRRPDVCPVTVGFVCGCDRKTYLNSCASARSGMAVLRAGECEVP